MIAQKILSQPCCIDEVAISELRYLSSTSGLDVPAANIGIDLAKDKLVRHSESEMLTWIMMDAKCWTKAVTGSHSR